MLVVTESESLNSNDSMFMVSEIKPLYKAAVFRCTCCFTRKLKMSQIDALNVVIRYEDTTYEQQCVSVCEL